jgi:hypothetical protein
MATVPSVQEPSASPLPFGEGIGGEKKGGADFDVVAKGETGAEAIPERRGFSMEQKRFIVESFACFQDISSIAAELAKRWQIKPDYRHIAQYDARRPQCSMGKALRRLYVETRERYVEGVSEVAIAHQAHRLRLVGRIVEKATNSKDYAAALKGLELAAKEMGGALSGQTTVRHEGMIGHVHATVEEARAEISARLAQVVEGGLLLPAPPMATPLLDATASATVPPAPPPEEGPG